MKDQLRVKSRGDAEADSQKSRKKSCEVQNTLAEEREMVVLLRMR